MPPMSAPLKFSPGIYEHAAALIDERPWTVSRSGELLTKAHLAAWERYRHPMIVVGIDVYNLEPEAYGAKIPEPKGNNMPSIAEHPCEEVDEMAELELLDPASVQRIQDVLAAGKALKARCPEAEVRIPVCGPFALAMGLIGMNELLMSLVEDKDELIEALTHLLKGQIAYLEAIQEADLLPIIFESGTTPPLLPVEHFETVEAPLLKELFAACKNLFGESPPCVIGGDAAPIIHSLLETEPGWVIAPSETDRGAFLNLASDKLATHVRVNLPAAMLLDQSRELIAKEVEVAVAIARSRDNTSVGCGVVPFESDPETVLFVKKAVEQA